MSRARRTPEEVRRDRRQVSRTWYSESRYAIAAGRLPRDPVRRVAVRLARAGGRVVRMGAELFTLRVGLRPSVPPDGELQQALPHMSREDLAHTRARLHDLARSLAYDQRQIDRLLDALDEAARRRLRLLDGGRA